MAMRQRGMVKPCVTSFCYTGTGDVVRLSNDRRCKRGKLHESTIQSTCFTSLNVIILQCSGRSIGGGFRHIYGSVCARLTSIL